MGQRGAEFGEVQPHLRRGIINDFIEIPITHQGLEHGDIFRMIAETYGSEDAGSAPSGFNAFRLGQQIFFWIGISNPVFGTGGAVNWITRLQLKPWWLRPNLEYRAAGFTSWTGLDATTFDSISQLNNRYVWIPSPKRLDITQYQTPPPPASPVRHSDSLFLDDVWTFELQDPNDAAYIADFPAPQVVSRWAAFFYPAMGYSLGFTWEATFAFTPNPPAIAQPLPRVSLTYAVGTLGGSVYQESIG